MLAARLLLVGGFALKRVHFWYYLFFLGMLTITDFIKILQKYYKQPGVSICLVLFRELFNACL